MRFFEYESRAIVAKAGIPVTKHGLAKTPEEARGIAELTSRGPVVIKSQVLTGGRMKAGGVQFADTPEEATKPRRARAATSRSTATCRAACWSTRGPQVKHEYYAGVVWDGIRKRPVMLFSDMGGIDIEEVAEQHPDHVARMHFSTLREFPELARQAADRLARDHRHAAEPPDADPHPPGAPVPRVRHDAGRDQPARRARGRLVRRARRAHGHGERGAAPSEGAAERARSRRRGDPAGARADAVRARRRRGRLPGPPRRGRQRDRVRRQPRSGDRCRRRLADAVRRRPRARRRPGQLLRDRRQPVGQQGVRAGQAGALRSRAWTRSR